MNRYQTVKLSEVITQCKNAEKITDMENEHYITLSSYGKGAHERVIKDGKYPVPFLGYRVSAGQFIYSRIDARNGAYDIIGPELEGFVVSKDFPIYDINTERIHPRFLLRSVLSDSFINQVKQSSFGATNRMRIKEEILENYSIKLPSLTEQEEIAALLDKAKGIIAFRKKELQKLDELIKARFVEMFGNPIVNEKGWEVAELNSVCDGIGDGLHGTPEYDENGGYPFINGNNLMNGVIEITPATKMVDEVTYKKHFIELSDNAILLSINGTLGKMAFYNGEEVMLGKSACYCNLKSAINREFVYGVMKTDAFMGFLESNATASTIKNVGLKAIRGFKLILPPEELQTQFVEFSRQVDKSKVV